MNNPFFIYITSFLLAITFYLFGWSDIYPTLSAGLVGFLILTFFVSFILGVFIYKKQKSKNTSIPVDSKVICGIVFICFLSTIECVLYPNVPLLQSIQGIDVEHNEYGIPLLHPLIISLTNFYSIYAFHIYLSTRKKLFLFYHLFFYIPNLIFFTRGNIVMIWISITFVFLQLKRLNFKNLFYICIAIILVLYLFGYLGNIRVPGNDEVILRIGKASQSFLESIIPKEYFWAYLYISSTLANLQNNIYLNDSNNNEYFLFFIREIMPRIITKYITQDYAEANLISPALTTGTMYSQAYSFLGWTGMIIIYIYMVIFINIVLNLLKRASSLFYVTGIAILNTMILLNVFDNMLVFSGTILPLSYVFIFGIIYEKKRYYLK